MRNLEHFGFGFSFTSLRTYKTQVLEFNLEYLGQFLLHSNPLKSFDLQFPPLGPPIVLMRLQMAAVHCCLCPPIVKFSPYIDSQQFVLRQSL